MLQGKQEFKCAQKFVINFSPKKCQNDKCCVFEKNISKYYLSFTTEIVY